MAGSRAVAPETEQERRSDSTALPVRARSDRHAALVRKAAGWNGSLRYASTRPKIVSGRTPSNFIASAAASVCSASSQAAMSGTSTISPTRFEHEPREVVVWQPVLQARWQQQLLITIAGDEVLSSHAWDRPKRSGQQGGSCDSLREERPPRGVGRRAAGWHGKQQVRAARQDRRRVDVVLGSQRPTVTAGTPRIVALRLHEAKNCLGANTVELHCLRRRVSLQCLLPGGDVGDLHDQPDPIRAAGSRNVRAVIPSGPNSSCRFGEASQ